MRSALHRFGWLTLLALCGCTSSPYDAAPDGDSGKTEAGPVASDAAVASEGPAPLPGEAGRGGESGSAGTMSAGNSAAGSAGGADDADAGHEPAADSGGPGLEPEDSSCLNGIGDYDDTGPFSYVAESAQALKLWVPDVPPGCKVPVVHFANGTGAACSTYQPVLERLASHGFLAVCAENTNTGSGVLGLEALEAALVARPELAARRLGSAGHHAGGQGAILTLQQAEAKWGSRAVYAGLAFAPASGHGAQPPSGSWLDAYAAVESPLLVVSGSADSLVSESWVGDSFDALGDSVEAYWYSAVDAPHIPLPIAQMQEASVAWFRWKLLDDASACEYFKHLPETNRWDARAKQHAADCQ